MTALTLFTLGTPHGRWPDIATQVLGSAAGGRLLDPAVSRWHEQVAGALAADGAPVVELEALARLEFAPAQLESLRALRGDDAAPWGGLDTRACWTAERLADGFPEARFLIWVESPAQVLAHWLQAGGQGDPQRVLKAWEAAAQRIVRLVQKHLARCLVVLADEAQRHPAALRQRVARWSGVELRIGPAAVTIAADSLGSLLARGLAAEDAASTRAFSALYASCVPLVEGSEAQPEAVDAVACVEGYHRLLRAAAASQAFETRLQSLIRDQDRSRQDMQAVREALETERGAHRRAVQEQELLLVQLHQVQEELERYYLAWRQLDSGAGVGASGATALQVDAVEIGLERDTPPHCEIGVVLRGVRAGGRLLPHVEARLVEHHGRPGLALFETVGQPTPLMAWRAGASEGERAYMLLVPADEVAREVLQSLGSGDWQFVTGVATAVAAALADTDAALAGRWRIAATRLRQQLAGLPDRLRFDGVEVAAGENGALEASFEQLSFGSTRCPHLRLRWSPRRADGAALELLAPSSPDEPPVLTAWPVDAQGGWARSWTLPVTDAIFWRTLGRHDRELLLGLLDALPAVAHRAQALDRGDAGAGGGLIAAASQPLRLAHRALHGSRLRRVLRALRGRVGV